MAAACDRSPTSLDAGQADGLRAVLASADRAGPGSPESMLRDAAQQLATAVEATPRLPVLEGLFSMAVARIEARQGASASAQMRDRQRALASEAWLTVDQGDVDGGGERLSAARRYMAVCAVEELGQAVVTAYVAVVGLAIERASVMVANPDADVDRPRRMAESARDIHADARDALLRADFAAAIDVASHAAGLLNTLFDQLERPL
jgi:hypothetical protein